jgi:hypothetical protein
MGHRAAYNAVNQGSAVDGGAAFRHYLAVSSSLKVQGSRLKAQSQFTFSTSSTGA